MAHRLLAIVPDGLEAEEPIEEIRRHGGDGVELRIVVPAVEATPFRHTLGDVDEPRRQAEERLGSTLRALRGAGLAAAGEVGDPDPVQAAQDALLKQPAGEIPVFEHEGGASRWVEE